MKRTLVLVSVCGLNVQTDYGEDPRPIGDPAADSFFPSVIESPLREDNGRTTTRFQKLKVSLDEQDVSPDSLLPSAGLTFR
jgi:hypothetical protein